MTSLIFSDSDADVSVRNALLSRAHVVNFSLLINSQQSLEIISLSFLISLSVDCVKTAADSTAFQRRIQHICIIYRRLHYVLLLPVCLSVCLSVRLSVCLCCPR